MISLLKERLTKIKKIITTYVAGPPSSGLDITLNLRNPKILEWSYDRESGIWSTGADIRCGFYMIQIYMEPHDKKERFILSYYNPEGKTEVLNTEETFEDAKRRAVEINHNNIKNYENN